MVTFDFQIFFSTFTEFKNVIRHNALNESKQDHSNRYLWMKLLSKTFLRFLTAPFSCSTEAKSRQLTLLHDLVILGFQKNSPNLITFWKDQEPLKLCASDIEILIVI